MQISRGKRESRAFWEPHVLQFWVPGDLEAGDFMENIQASSALWL